MASPTQVANGQLRPIRCNSCGRFLGFGHIEAGELYLKCKNCKMWTCVLEGKTALALTGEEIYAKLRAIEDR